jgi:hypothetical protein
VARAGLGNLIGLLGASGAYTPMFAVVLTVAFLGFAADRLYVPGRGTAVAMAGLAHEAPPASRKRLAAASLRARAGRLFDTGGRLLVILALLGGWELVAPSGVVSSYLLPAFSDVMARIWEDARSGDLQSYLALTVYRGLLSFAIAAAAGVLIASLMHGNRAFHGFSIR